MRCHNANRLLDSMVTLPDSHLLCCIRKNLISYTYTVPRSMHTHTKKYVPINIAIECVMFIIIHCIAIVQFKIIIVCIIIFTVYTVFMVAKKITVVGFIINVL